MNAPGMTPRWPKGPFPERYRFPAVEARLAHGWSTEREEAYRSLVLGLDPVGPEDPWVRLVRVPDPSRRAERFRALRARAKELELVAFAWIAPARARRDGLDAQDVLGVVPTSDPVDAVSATGVAGPVHGIGMPAIVRFLVTLRSFGAFEILAMGEDCLELAFEAKNDEALARVAERVLRICPPLARRESAEALAVRVRETSLLRMDWA
ncbi:MAG: DUF4253 domain-containing protein [Sandaracinaceae bacterium]|nr:DUF4253 domain-containing protein [Sandaracinaceae bacterium]